MEKSSRPMSMILFGNEVNPNTKDENPFRYCGEYFDKETDSIYLRARYYQAYLGRFLTRDTYTGEADDPLSLHLYTYCGNDGVNRIDPSGNVFETILDIASIGHSIYCLVTEPSWRMQHIWHGILSNCCSWCTWFLCRKSW